MSAPTTLRLLTPPEWRRLPLTDDAELQRVAEAVVARRFEGVENQPVLRRELTASLLAQARDARAAGGFDLYLSYEGARGAPLAVSLLVSLLPAAPGEDSVRALARQLEREGASVEVVRLPAGSAARRTAVQPADGVQSLGVPDGTDCLTVDYALPGPSGSVLLLAFSSPLVQVADALAELFEAVATSLEWSA